MKTRIKPYNDLKRTVNFFSKRLKFDKFLKKVGRKLAASVEDVLALSLFRQASGIAAKKPVCKIFQDNLNRSCKTLAVSLIRRVHSAAAALTLVMKSNRQSRHLIKRIDSAGIPVCLFKNAHNHKTMKELAAFGRSSRGVFFGLKSRMAAGLRRKLLSVKFTAGNVDGREAVFDLTDEITGYLTAGAGYLKKSPRQKYYQENKRIMTAKPGKNMKKIMTKFEEMLCGTRMLIELNFRGLKMFHGLIAGLPGPVNGYSANYICSLSAYQIA